SVFSLLRRPPTSPLFSYTTLFRSDPATGLVVDLVPGEDALAGERALMPAVTSAARAGDLWIADRNFSTRSFLGALVARGAAVVRSEEHTSELQSRENLVCRLLLEK